MDSRTPPVRRYETKTDIVPEFWQFLKDLRSDDLVAELIQNEVDAGSTHTVLAFEKDRLRCFGNGHPVDADGWARLEYLRGAGHEAPQKEGLIGVKNHGLKACFTIGDDIHIRSAGMSAHQTLYNDGPANPPYPAASNAVPDELAPDWGCEIEVPYRKRLFAVEVGEKVTLRPFLTADVKKRFLAAVKDIPARFIGVMRPEKHPEHLVEVTHYELGSVRFHFRCGKVTRQGSISIFFRECSVEASQPELSANSLRERVVMRRFSRPNGDTHSIPRFYRDGNGILVDVAWREDSKGAPVLERGHLRYPIAYPPDASASTSGVGAQYSAPFVSDTERHGLAAQETDWNDGLIEACDQLLVEAFGKLLVPRHGSKAFSVILGSGETDPSRFEMLLGRISEAKVLPVVRAGAKGKKATKARTGKYCIVPVFTMRPDRVAPELAALAPNDGWLLAPGTPQPVVRRLASMELPGWGETHITFDEMDVLARLKPHEECLFPWPNEAAWQKELKDPKRVVLYLDVLVRAKALSRATLSLDKAGVYLPDTDSRASPIEKLRSGTNVPPNLPGLQLPARVHPFIAGHPALKAWRIPVFSFDDFLDSLNAAEASDQRCTDLFEWMCDNHAKIPKASWRKLRSLPIWLDIKGDPGPLERFCDPRLPSRAGEILSSILRRPHPKAVKLAGLVRRRGLSLKIRAHPNADEIDAWLQQQASPFPRDRSLTGAERERFRRFEGQLKQLVNDQSVAAVPEDLTSKVPALSQAGFLCPVDQLVRPSPSVDRLALLPEHLLDRPGRELDVLMRPAQIPSASMIKAALCADPENEPTLITRLQALSDVTLKDQPWGISHIRCIRVGDVLRAPAELAFKGNSGDYWGEWRLAISGANLARIDQNLYKRAGVLPAEPDPVTSKWFFEWLASKPDLVETHLPQVLRHIDHARGTRCWWNVNDRVPCIPVERDGVSRLVSLWEAISISKRCYIDDFPDLGRAIRQGDATISLAILKHEQVSVPITTVLRDAGMRSLRSVAKDPVSVTGCKPSPPPSWVIEILQRLRSYSMVRELRKRLDQMEVDLSWLEPRWQRHLADIRAVETAVIVSAVFKIDRRRIVAPVTQGFDEASGVLWLASADSELDLRSALFSALAERIFARGAPRHLVPALEWALRVEIHESRLQAPREVDEDDDEGLREDEDEDILGEAPNGHHDWQPDPTKNRPAPRPLSTNSGKAKTPSEPKKPVPGRPVAPDEDVQRRELKAEHYAWHCQIGLARMQPADLAPAGSYVEHQENRKRLIEAHHPDAVKSGGARHAGNLLILSHLEHHRYGQRISRGEIIAALKRGGTRRVLRFGSGKGATKLEGSVIEVEITATGEKVPIFFTDDHRDYWLLQAK